jgi:hypothetical protein
MQHLDLELIGPETQICSHGIRCTSYVVTDGLPLVSESSGLRKFLEYKRAFDEMVFAINEPEECPQVQFAPPSPTILKQPASSEALEEHTSSPADDLNQPDEPVLCVAVLSPQSELTPVFVREDAKCDMLDEPCEPQATDSAIFDDSGDVETVGVMSQTSEKPLINRANYDPESDDAAQMGNSSSLDGPQLSPTTEIEVLEPVFVQKRRPNRSVPLTPKERTVGLKFGLLKPPIPKTERKTSVLDEYQEHRRMTPQRTHKVPNTLVVKRICEQGERCVYCQRVFGSHVSIDGRIDKLAPTTEHISPRAKKLNNHWDNIAAACQICQRLKSSRSFDSIEQAQTVLQAAWKERGYGDVRLIPFKRVEVSSMNWN